MKALYSIGCDLLIFLASSHAQTFIFTHRFIKKKYSEQPLSPCFLFCICMCVRVCFYAYFTLSSVNKDQLVRNYVNALPSFSHCLGHFIMLFYLFTLFASFKMNLIMYV